MTYILGISAFYHDAAACLVRDGEIIAAAQEERFTRKKHDESFPENAVQFCLDHAGIDREQIDHVAFYDKPLLTFERLLETYIDYAPSGFRSFLKAMPVWMTEKLWTRETLARETGFEGKILFTEHHESHAASAFYPSPFESAAILTIDGVGEWATSSVGVGRGNRVELLSELRFPHSLGLLYSAFTYFTGFKVNSGEYKLMGLAPYGEPIYTQKILDELIDLRDDGSLRLNMQYFNFAAGLTMTNDAFAGLFGGPARKSESEITQREMDLARSVQEVTEIAMLRMADYAHRETGEKNLCLAGGVALNCVGNGRILREGPFENLWIQPAAGDAGGAVGAALSVWHQYLGNEQSIEHRTGKDAMSGSYLGPSFSTGEIRSSLDAAGAVYYEHDVMEIVERTANQLSEGKVVGWFQGRMEFGPRALGNRSILGDPRSPEMQRQMNLKIKYRESFRPFAPAVLRERVTDFFEITDASPYMLLVAPVSEKVRVVDETGHNVAGLDKLQVPRSTIPAVTHVDLSARVQTVERGDNERFYDLIARFGEITGTPVLINTSFNVRGEPIVCTPEDAFRCFMRTEMDVLVVGDFMLLKTEQTAEADSGDIDEIFPMD
ncbi:MAG TPA: carbamoyltransferase [Pyrinomonadaceae bacterium]|nr:carbamoyltransferase [Pyrinomonadaceae bacterium]